MPGRYVSQVGLVKFSMEGFRSRTKMDFGSKVRWKILREEMGKLLQSSRLLSELCPGGAGRPIELGIFIPHSRHLLQTQLWPSTLRSTEFYGGVVRWAEAGWGTVVREKYCSHKAP